MRLRRCRWSPAGRAASAAPGRSAAGRGVPGLRWRVSHGKRSRLANAAPSSPVPRPPACPQRGARPRLPGRRGADLPPSAHLLPGTRKPHLHPQTPPRQRSPCPRLGQGLLVTLPRPEGGGLKPVLLLAGQRPRRTAGPRTSVLRSWPNHRGEPVYSDDTRADGPASPTGTVVQMLLLCPDAPPVPSEPPRPSRRRYPWLLSLSATIVLTQLTHTQSPFTPRPKPPVRLWESDLCFQTLASHLPPT